MPSQPMDPAAYVARQLRERIASGRYPAHSLLPSQRQLAEEFGVGRAYVRKAVGELTRAGLVRAHQGAGTQVQTAPVGLSPTRIVVVHSPMGGWISQEGTLTLTGVLDRLRTLGYHHDRMAFAPPAGDRTDGGGGAGHTTLAVADLAQLPERYAGAVVLDASFPQVAEAALALQACGFPLVAANPEIDLAVDATTLDHTKVAAEAVRVLAGFGHRHIAFMGRDPQLYFYGKALAGFRRGGATEGLPPERLPVVYAEATSALSAYLAFRPLLAQPEPPTAVVAARDVLAQGVCQAAAEAGLAVGYDLSVIGYDGVSWPDGATLLTTFHEPCYAMGATAVDMLVERLVHGWREPEQRVLDAPLVLRCSVGPPPRSRERAAAGATGGARLAKNG